MFCVSKRRVGHNSTGDQRHAGWSCFLSLVCLFLKWNTTFGVVRWNGRICNAKIFIIFNFTAKWSKPGRPVAPPKKNVNWIDSNRICATKHSFIVGCKEKQCPLCLGLPFVNHSSEHANKKKCTQRTFTHTLRLIYYGRSVTNEPDTKHRTFVCQTSQLDKDNCVTEIDLVMFFIFSFKQLFDCIIFTPFFQRFDKHNRAHNPMHRTAHHLRERVKERRKAMKNNIYSRYIKKKQNVNVKRSAQKRHRHRYMPPMPVHVVRIQQFNSHFFFSSYSLPYTSSFQYNIVAYMHAILNGWHWHWSSHGWLYN